MRQPTIVGQDEWLAARKALLATEAAATEARRAATAQRQRLPMVRVDKKYVFEGDNGTVTLADMFDGRRQLIIYHMMFDPAWDEGCRFCSLLMDDVGHPAHLHARNTTFAIVSRARLEKLQRHRERMGWPLPWYSSFDSDFNYDFHVTLDESIAPVEYNYKDKATLIAEGQPFFTEGEQGAISVFLRDGDDVFHTYSSFGWENDILHSTFNYLDLTPMGRQVEGPGSVAIRHHDRYPN